MEISSRVNGAAVTLTVMESWMAIKLTIKANGKTDYPMAWGSTSSITPRNIKVCSTTVYRMEEESSQTNCFAMRETSVRVCFTGKE